MKEHELYKSWKEEKHRIDPSQNFTDNVMDQVYQWEQSRKSPRIIIERLVELISFHPLAKIGLVAIGAVVGAVRLIIMIQTILGNGVING